MLCITIYQQIIHTTLMNIQLDCNVKLACFFLLQYKKQLLFAEVRTESCWGKTIDDGRSKKFSALKWKIKFSLLCCCCMVVGSMLTCVFHFPFENLFIIYAKKGRWREFWNACDMQRGSNKTRLLIDFAMTHPDCELINYFRVNN